MKKKKSRNRAVLQKQKTANQKLATSWVRYVTFFSAIVLLVFVSGVAVKAIPRTHVLGESVFLARGGDDGGSSGVSDSGNGGGSSAVSDNSGQSWSNISNSGSSNTSGSTANTVSARSHTESSSPSNTMSSSVSSGTLVDCLGPDKKHFQTTFKSCSDLNNFWHNSNFTFTPLRNVAKLPSEPINKISEVRKTEMPKPEVENENDFQKTTTQGGTFKSRIDTKGKKIKDTASEGENDSIRTINDALKDQEVEVGTTAAKDFIIKKNGVEAETVFPLSVDSATNKIQVTTPTGIKEVTILPDEAVHNVINTKVIDSVETQAAPVSGENTIPLTMQKVTLTEYNNQPVFTVHGFANKKILGIIPISFAKTVFVSAQTGQQVKVDETALSKFFETFSF